MTAGTPSGPQGFSMTDCGLSAGDRDLEGDPGDRRRDAPGEGDGRCGAAAGHRLRGYHVETVVAGEGAGDRADIGISWALNVTAGSVRSTEPSMVLAPRKDQRHDSSGVDTDALHGRGRRGPRPQAAALAEGLADRQPQARLGGGPAQVVPGDLEALDRVELATRESVVVAQRLLVVLRRGNGDGVGGAAVDQQPGRAHYAVGAIVGVPGERDRGRGVDRAAGVERGVVGSDEIGPRARLRAEPRAALDLHALERIAHGRDPGPAAFRGRR